jgi:hypothetical protein
MELNANLIAANLGRLRILQRHSPNPSFNRVILRISAAGRINLPTSTLRILAFGALGHPIGLAELPHPLFNRTKQSQAKFSCGVERC